MAKHNQMQHPVIQKALFSKAVITTLPPEHRLSDIMDYLITDNPFPSTLDVTNYDRVANMAGTIYAETEWLKYRQIYKCRKDIILALLDSDDMNFDIADLNIPFPAMYFDLSALDLHMTVNMPGRFTGVFVAITPEDDENHSLAISFLHEHTLRNFSGLLVDYKQDRTVNDILAGVIRETNKLGEFAELDTLIAATKLTFMLMAYVSSHEPDVTEHKPKVILLPAGRGKNMPVQTKTWTVGEHYMVEKLRQEPPDVRIKYEEHHGTVKPHVRRGHWHTYCIGKGRTERVVKWLAPMYIGNPDETPTTTIREKH